MKDTGAMSLLQDHLSVIKQSLFTQLWNAASDLLWLYNVCPKCTVFINNLS